jgi:TusA-related sulfurtransferase
VTPDPDGAAPEQPSITVDARGRRCPLPVIDLARAARDAPAGSLVQVLADDPAAATDIPAWCRMRGQSFVGSRARDDGTTAYEVRIT